jgi:hypothetical protein
MIKEMARIDEKLKERSEEMQLKSKCTLAELYITAAVLLKQASLGQESENQENSVFDARRSSAGNSGPDQAQQCKDASSTLRNTATLPRRLTSESKIRNWVDKIIVSIAVEDAGQKY